MAIAEFSKIPSPQKLVDAYLADLRARLHGLSAEQATDIVEEIRSYIRDATAPEGVMTQEAVNAALQRLGTPQALAASYVTDNLLERAERHRMPWTILRAMFHWALLSVKGFLAFIVCAVGYAFGASFFIAALIKPFNPRAGLWLVGEDEYSLVLGVAKYPPRGHELLGWTLIPIGLALGGGTVLATTHFAKWCIRSFRKSRQLRAAAR